ncbi:cGMP-specific 3',5'-cyclic phosphodiesterase, partial [Geodia barretti]
MCRGMLMTACDVAAITKPWSVQKRVAVTVAHEFFEQGDREREQLDSEPMAMMDRKKKHELPKMQVGFIDFICLPLYEPLANLVQGLVPLLEGVKKNRHEWQNLADNPELTVVDSDPKVSETSPCPTCPATADVKHSTANQTEI